jgi:hypothetical protein
MAITRKEEERALSKDERELVERSHHPVLQEISDADLSSLVKLVRERREKATDLAKQRRREMRGKGSPKGSAPSTSDEGSKLKAEVLAMAMRRLNKEVERRRRMAASVSLVENARNALLMKQEGGETGPDFNSRHAHKGMRSIKSDRREKLVRPMELGRQRKAGKVAQAKRDGR